MSDEKNGFGRRPEQEDFPPRGDRRGNGGNGGNGGDNGGGRKDPPRYGRATKTMAFWAVLILLFLMVFHTVYTDPGREAVITWTEFRDQVEDGNIKNLHIVLGSEDSRGELLTPAMTESQGVSQAYTRFKVMLPEDSDMTELIREKNPTAEIRKTKSGSAISTINSTIKTE